MKLNQNISQWVFILFLFVISCKKEKTQEQSTEYKPTPYTIQIPAGFPKIDIPSDNPMTVEGIALGRKLFYDPILSKDNTVSCASCHKQENGFTDPARFSAGVDGKIGTIQSMTIINPGWNIAYFWNGRAKSLEEQVLGPITNPVEMNSTWEDVIAKLKAIPEYRNDFKKAFGTDKIDSTLVTKAIAQFERTLISGNSKFEQWNLGKVQFTDTEYEGYNIFFSEIGDCFHCHGNLLFQNLEFANNGLDLNPDNGLYDVTKNLKDKGKFKIPTLRNIELSAPYMHDGRFNTLEEVVDFYSSGVQHNSPNISPLMEFSESGGVHLSSEQKVALIAFLKTLTDQEFVTNPKFAKP
ncbi:MAG: cytochrome-c peroxidase [Bacteroidetes bacterium]|nr:cytochrome-c peroxidase [Bacteroidota bacterium]